jgi:hypothetical protein
MSVRHALVATIACASTVVACTPLAVDTPIADDGGTTGDGAADATCATCCAFDALVAYYPFDLDVLDHSGNGHTIMARSVTPVEGKIGGAYAFDGQASSMSPTGAFLVSGPRTFCAWIRPAAHTGIAQPIFVGGVVRGADFYSVQSSLIAVPPGGQVDVCTAPSSANHLLIDDWNTPCAPASQLRAPPDAWTFVCFAFDGVSRTTIFANGVSEVVNAPAYGYPLSQLSFGSNPVGGTTTGHTFTGAIDEVSLWSRALDAREMNALYADGSGCAPR